MAQPGRACFAKMFFSVMSRSRLVMSPSFFTTTNRIEPPASSVFAISSRAAKPPAATLAFFGAGSAAIGGLGVMWSYVRRASAVVAHWRNTVRNAWLQAVCRATPRLPA